MTKTERTHQALRDGLQDCLDGFEKLEGMPAQILLRCFIANRIMDEDLNPALIWGRLKMLKEEK